MRFVKSTSSISSFGIGNSLVVAARAKHRRINEIRNTQLKKMDDAFTSPEVRIRMNDDVRQLA